MKIHLRRFLSYVLVAALSAGIAYALPRPPEKLGQLEQLITERFIGEADRDALLDAAANAMVNATGDRWSYYLSAREYTLQKEQSANAYVGIGITIQYDEEAQGFRILEVTSGSGAETAGLKPGDLLTEVEGQDVRQAESADVRTLVMGKEGSAVSLAVLRGSERLEFQVLRQKIKTQVAAWQLLSEDTALVQIRNFDTRCAEETIAAMEAAMDAGARKLIFDVRNNHGGYASELVKVLDYLLPEGELFRTLRYDGKENTDMSDEKHLDVPMAVLVNSRSYSAAEFFAAALQEYEAALVVGEQTVGKGYYQVTYPLRDGSAVALSIGKYFTPKGVSLAGVGITPDIVSPLTQEQAADLAANALAAEDDPNIQQALAALNQT